MSGRSYQGRAVVVLLVIVLLFSIFPISVMAQVTTVSVVPSTQSIRVGENFAVGIYVVPGEPISGIALKLRFNPLPPIPQKPIESRVKPILTVGGYQYRDLDNNGVVDPYENWMLPVENRVEDLLPRMTLKEKAGQMVHPTFTPRPDGSPPAGLDNWIQNMGTGFLLAHDFPSSRAAANCMNQIQEWAENSRLGIPVIISMDSVHGLSYVQGSLIHPHSLGLAATENVELVRRLSEFNREESLAIGVRMSLSPIADVATEPRWGRVMECFGENADLAAEMVRAEVEAMQAGSELNENSVLTCVKHFPGSGPQKEGVDMAPIVSTLDTLEYHLKTFRAAVEAGTAAVMPYYSIPLVLDNMAALGSERTLRLLRENLGFTGLIQSDWGMVRGIQQAGMYIGRSISYEEAVQIGINAGINIIGGEAIDIVLKIVELVENEDHPFHIPEEKIDDSVRRILTAKFKLGVFDNPYVDPDYAEEIVGCEEHQALSLEAARQSMTLLKNDGTLPLTENMSILVAGMRAGDIESLTGGWTCRQVGPGILDGIRNRAGENAQVFYEPDNVERAAELAKYCDVAVVVVGESFYTHNPPWGVNHLDLTSSQSDMLMAINETGIPIVVVAIMPRPYILTWCDEHANAILAAYLPGTQGARAIAEVLFGDYNPHGKLPVQVPRSMEQVHAQREDVPYDIEDPLYDHGFGLTYGGRPHSEGFPWVLIIAGVTIAVVVAVAIAFRKIHSR